jgi:hypothetical protein
MGLVFPRCESNQTKKERAIAPYYLSSTYKKLFERAITTFASHLAGLPPDVRSRIVAAQAMFGSTGDDTPWHGTPVNAAYDITTDQWDNFTMSEAPFVCAAYASVGIHVLWNKNDTFLTRLLAECPGSYIKCGMVSHSFQVNLIEADNYLGKGAICHTEGYHCRGESWPFMESGYWLQAPIWATYWHLMWQLTFGNDIPGLSEPSLLNASFEPFYRLFNRYAASVRPPVTADTWPGAIVALRDGLDSSDTSRFPEAVYGTATLQNQDRLLAIAKAHAPFGAAEGDPKAAASEPMASRRRTSMNDVGWRIWPGNYGNGLITQLAPANTSIGWWRVGRKDEPFGRFARGFQRSTGRTAMGFQLDRRLWGGLPLDAAVTGLTVHVTYYDGVGCGFNVLIDSRSTSTATTNNIVNFTTTTTTNNNNNNNNVNVSSSSACARVGTPVACGGSGRWITASFDVGATARFGRGCLAQGANILGADIVLESNSRADAIVHGLQVVVETSTPSNGDDGATGHRRWWGTSL